MNQRNTSLPSDDWMDKRVEAYVDDALPDDEAERFEVAMQAVPRWKAQVNHAERIHQTLATKELPTCPPSCTEAILDQTVRAEAVDASASEVPERTASWLDRVTEALRVLGQPAYSTALAALLVAAVAWVIASGSFMITDSSETPPTTDAHIEAPYTDDDVAQAQAEAEWVLAYISDVSQDASSTAEREMERALSPFYNEFETPPEAPSTVSP